MARYVPLNVKFTNLAPLLQHLPGDERDRVEFHADLTWMQHAAATILILATGRREDVPDIEAQARAATGYDPDYWPLDWAAIRLHTWKDNLL